MCLKIFYISFLTGLMTFLNNSGEDRSLNIWEPFLDMVEIQLTSDQRGHFLNNRQYFCPDDSWIVYDTRNDKTAIGQTCCIEMVNTLSGEIRQLYRTTNQTRYGPGVGAVTFSPVDKVVLFIHGLSSCNESHPYGFSRRTGVAVYVSSPGMPVFMDARDVLPPFTPGALRGGTHAHSWSGDGRWISFTYNDDVMSHLEKIGADQKKDLRMVGVMSPSGPVRVDSISSGEHVSGKMFSVIVSKVTENPEPGSDQIDRAYEEGWIGRNGYRKTDGSWQKRAVAFLGDTRDRQGNKLTEVFVVDIPDDVTRETTGYPLAGTETTRPMPPAGCVQRRITFTGQKKYPGVRGPRHWLKSSPDGSVIFFLMADERNFIQVYGISPNGDEIVQVTYNDFSLETAFSLSPDGNFLAYGSQQKIYLTHIETGDTRAIANAHKPGISGLSSIEWSNDGKMLACNRRVAANDSTYHQVFLLKNIQ